jgi:hypothetical protein
MRHVILDTDIGTDVDDMLALVFLENVRIEWGISAQQFLCDRSEEYPMISKSWLLDDSRILPRRSPGSRSSDRASRDCI